MPQFSLGTSSVIIKGILRCKFFQCVRSNSLTQSKFHTAQPDLVRGVAGRKHFPYAAQNGESKKVTGPEDYFGIECDDGVIYASDKKTKLSADKVNNSNSLSSSEKENVFNTSYGHLRFDTNNQPKNHGQFEKNIAEWEYTYGGNMVREKIHDLRRQKGSSLEKCYTRIANKTEVSEDMVTKSTSDMCKNSEVSGTDGYRSEIDGVGERNDDLGFIDRAYFYDPNEVRSSTDKHKTKSSEDSDVLETNLQGNDVKEFTQNHISNQSKGKSSYIDSVYFEDSYEIGDNMPGHLNQVELETVAPSIEKPMRNYAETSPKLKTPENITRESDIINSMHFGNIVDSKLASNEESTFISQDSGVKAPNEGSIYANSELRNMPSSHVENTITPQDRGDLGVCSLSKASDGRDMHTSSESENTCKDMGADSTSSLNQEAEANVSPPVQQNQILKTFNEEVDSLKDSMKEKKLIKELEKELNTSEVETGHQASANEDNVHTAYRYVLQLRKTETKPDIDSGVEFDSKGYRILKNEVPDLSHLTRTELTDLLSECILYYNDDIVVLNKPYNLVVHESKTTMVPALSSVLDDLACKLDKTATQPRLYTVHRIDKETTGCLLLARNELAAQKLKTLFAQRQIEKNYLVVTTRVPNPYEGIIDIPITEGKVENRVRMVLQPAIPKEIKYKSHVKNGKRAITHYKVTGVSENAALLDVRPETGIKHQIRVHLGFGLNCPILGDHKYSHLTKLAPQKLPGDILRNLEVRQSKVRYVPMHIHARAVRIPMYLGDRDLFVSAPLPKHFRKTLKCLKFEDVRKST